MNGEIVAFVAPTPRPSKIIATANPGGPAPRSSATGRDVVNIIKEPHNERLHQKYVTNSERCTTDVM